MPLLFSYGTLQLQNVQLDTFGRLLESDRDRLSGYDLAQLRIEDATVVASSGLTHHPVARSCGDPKRFIDGMVFEISDEELAGADHYEVPEYKRVLCELASGALAWVYVDARDD